MIPPTYWADRTSASWSELAPNGKQRQSACQPARQRAGRTGFSDWVNEDDLTQNGNERHDNLVTWTDDHIVVFFPHWTFFGVFLVGASVGTDAVVG
jgi:hypothetical protein